MAGRQFVAYSEHAFLERPPFARIGPDVEELRVNRFTDVAVCITETDIRSPAHLRFLGKMVVSLADAGIRTMADFWGGAGVFGGEGRSLFTEHGETPCFCNPHLGRILGEAADKMVDLGIGTWFMDEPEVHCPAHRGREQELLQLCLDIAAERGLKSTVCMTANEARSDLLMQVAAMPQVAEIATDPYWPNAFKKYKPQERPQYVDRVVQNLQTVAETYGKPYHAWVQGWTEQGEEQMVAEHIRIIKNHGVDVAFWDFHACERNVKLDKRGKGDPALIWSTALKALREEPSDAGPVAA